MSMYWPGAWSPWTDPTGKPYSGAHAFFFASGTTTPLTTYRDSGLGQSNTHPVVADASGRFPPIFMSPGDYRIRVLDSSGVTLLDIDGISVPTTESGGGGGGDTPVELLQRVGMYVFRHGTGSMSGWVRANGRSIGSASSGATERANADCEALFTFLWNQDSTLVVSGGRGANAASDWAGGKNIALPDLRLRGLIGMKSMGSGASTLYDGVSFDGAETGDTLGATIGTATVELVINHMPAHDHGGSTGSAGAHSHTYNGFGTSTPSVVGQETSGTAQSPGQLTSTAPSHAHSIAPQGSGAGHANVQPSAVATCYLKL